MIQTWGSRIEFTSGMPLRTMDGKSWLNGLYHAANKIRLPLVDDRSLSTAVYETFNRQYIDVVYLRYGGMLISKHDEKCYTLFKEKHQPSQHLFADGPDDLKAAYLNWFADALEAVVKADGYGCGLERVGKASRITLAGPLPASAGFVLSGAASCRILGTPGTIRA